jgi:hypothetical protein
LPCQDVSWAAKYIRTFLFFLIITIQFFFVRHPLKSFSHTLPWTILVDIFLSFPPTLYKVSSLMMTFYWLILFMLNLAITFSAVILFFLSLSTLSNFVYNLWSIFYLYLHYIWIPTVENKKNTFVAYLRIKFTFKFAKIIHNFEIWPFEVLRQRASPYKFLQSWHQVSLVNSFGGSGLALLVVKLFNWEGIIDKGGFHIIEVD